MAESAQNPMVSRQQAVAIAEADATQVYDKLHLYHMKIQLDHSGWVVDFEWKREDAQSGGPHYLIDATTGAILSKRYEQ